MRKDFLIRIQMLQQNKSKSKSSAILALLALLVAAGAVVLVFIAVRASRPNSGTGGNDDVGKDPGGNGGGNDDGANDGNHCDDEPRDCRFQSSKRRCDIGYACQSVKNEASCSYSPRDSRGEELPITNRVVCENYSECYNKSNNSILYTDGNAEITADTCAANGGEWTSMDGVWTSMEDKSQWDCVKV